jgi:hypothetical protein
MEIDFNTNPVGKPAPAQAAAQSTPSRPVNESAPFEAIDSLEAKLRQLSDLRPDLVERGKSLASDVKYPPDEILNGIANLLAMKLE